MNIVNTKFNRLLLASYLAFIGACSSDPVAESRIVSKSTLEEGERGNNSISVDQCGASGSNVCVSSGRALASRPLQPVTQVDVIDEETGKGVLKDWPNIPARFEIPDYFELARAYEYLTFVNNDDVTRRFAWSYDSTYLQGSPYFRGLSILQPPFLRHFVYEKPTNFLSQSTVIFPGLISSGLLGSPLAQMQIKMPKELNVKSPVNLARMMKAYYHTDPATSPPKENGIFTDHFANHLMGLGDEFWFTLIPNVYAMQLQSLVSPEVIESGKEPGEPTFDELTRRAVDTFVRMNDYLKGSGQKTGNYSFPYKNSTSLSKGLPVFDFSGVDIAQGTFKARDQNCDDAIGAGVRLKTSEVTCNKASNPYPKYEGDTAGSFALLGLMAYDRWKDPRYLQMADESIEALLNYSPNFNPFYEVQYSYGILAAARYNRHFQGSHSLEQLLKWYFSRSNLKNINPKDQKTWPNYIITNARPEVGIVNEDWGEFPAYGFWAGKSPWFSNGGYAFYMNTIHQAVTVAPIVKYYPEYAALFGKYLLHVASNSKVFFPNCALDKNQNPKSLAALNGLLNDTKDSQDLPAPMPRSKYCDYSFVTVDRATGEKKYNYKAIPYESAKRDPRLGLVATGDAVEHNWAATDNSLYSGSVTGFFAKILTKTDTPEIPMWDLDATDFQSPTMFPTYLLYNPLPSKTTVLVKRDAIKSRNSSVTCRGNSYCGVWDSVTHRWQPANMNDFRFTLNPGQAMVLSFVPSGTTTSSVGKTLVGSTSSFSAVLDYNYGAK